MFRKLPDLCLIILIIEVLFVCGRRTICNKAGLKQISDINKNVCQGFAEPEMCTRITLIYNSIKVIKSFDFEKYHLLYHLYLGSNMIYSIDADAFKNTVLQTLVLISNKLTCIPDFSAIATTLNYLNLNNNFIEREDCLVGNSTSPYKHKITELRLCNMSLTGWGDYLFMGIPIYGCFALVPCTTDTKTLCNKVCYILSTMQFTCQIPMNRYHLR